MLGTAWKRWKVKIQQLFCHHVYVPKGIFFCESTRFQCAKCKKYTYKPKR